MLNQTVKLTVDFLGVLMFTENGARNYIFLSDVSGKIPLIVRWVLCWHGHEYTIYSSFVKSSAIRYTPL